MDIELQSIGKNGKGNEGAACLHNEEVTPTNGAGPTYSPPEAADRYGHNSLTGHGSNGDTHPSRHEAEAEERLLPQATNTYTHHQQSSSVCTIKRELNEIVFWRIRLWMIIISIFLFIFVVIGISLALCSVIHEDVDEKYDPSSFEIPRYFNGSFRLTNQNFTAELLTLSSNQSQTLSAELEEKLGDLYRSSPALGRYFSQAQIHSFRNGSVIAEYQLKFLMPAEHDQLQKFTLSREVVYNVLRQFIYDQETEETDPMYIDPVSLNMM